MENIIIKLQLVSDPELKALLIKSKHKDNILLPSVLRKLLLKLNFFRWDLNMGIKYEAEKLIFFFYISEFAAHGSPKEVLENISSLVQVNGFTSFVLKENEYGYLERIYKMEWDDFIHEIILIGPERFVGTEDPCCGGSITYNLEYKKPIEAITTSNLFEVYPQLICPELPPELESYFAQQQIFTLSYGGTWQRYYDWGIRIQHPDRLLAEKQFQEVAELLTQIGFFFDHEFNGVSIYYKTNAYDPIIYLRLEENNIFYFRIQPHS